MGLWLYRGSRELADRCVSILLPTYLPLHFHSWAAGPVLPVVRAGSSTLGAACTRSFDVVHHTLLNVIDTRGAT